MCVCACVLVYSKHVAVCGWCDSREIIIKKKKPTADCPRYNNLSWFRDSGTQYSPSPPPPIRPESVFRRNPCAHNTINGTGLWTQHYHRRRHSELLCCRVDNNIIPSAHSLEKKNPGCDSRTHAFSLSLSHAIRGSIQFLFHFFFSRFFFVDRTKYY